MARLTRGVFCQHPKKKKKHPSRALAATTRVNEVKGRRGRAGFCQAFVMQRLHSTPSMVRGGASAALFPGGRLRLPRVPQRQGVRDGLCDEEDTPAKRQSRSGGLEWANGSGEGHDGAAPRFGGGLCGSAVGFVVARLLLGCAWALTRGSDKACQQGKKTAAGAPPRIAPGAGGRARGAGGV